MSTDYETRDEKNAKTQSSTNFARVRNNNPRRRLVGLLLLLLLPPPEPTPITRRRSSCFLPCPPLPFRFSLKFLPRVLLSTYNARDSILFLLLLLLPVQTLQNTRDVMSSTCVRPKERGKKKNQKEGRGGGPLECACASLPRAKMNEAFFFFFFPNKFQKTHLLVSLPARPMLPPTPSRRFPCSQFPPSFSHGSVVSLVMKFATGNRQH